MLFLKQTLHTCRSITPNLSSWDASVNGALLLHFARQILKVQEKPDFCLLTLRVCFLELMSQSATDQVAK